MISDRSPVGEGRSPVGEGRSPACVTAGGGDCAEATGSNDVGVAVRARDGSVADSVVGPVNKGKKAALK